MTGAILLLGLGLALVMAEILFPSFGLLSVCAVASLVGSVLLAFQESSAVGSRFLVALAVLLPATMFAAFKLLPMTPFGRGLKGLPFKGRASVDERDLGLMGVEGVVEAPCRPAGMARLEGRRVDVVSRGGFLNAGVRVCVVEVSGNRVVVAPIVPPEIPTEPKG